MLNSFAAEKDKLLRRPATWIFAVIFVILTVLFGYVLNYLIYKNPPPNTPADIQEGMLDLVLPENSMGNVISGFPLFGGGIALIFGAIVMGSEYRWGTLKTIFLHQPRRLNFIAGKVLAMIMILLIFVLAVFAASEMTSYLIASAESATISWPSFGDIVKTLLVGWYVLVMCAMLGALLAVLFRGTALAVGIGLVYVLVIENMMRGYVGQIDFIDNIAKVLPGLNADSLASTIVPSSIKDDVAGIVDIVDGTQAVFVMAAYTVGLIVVMAILIRGRDVIR